MSRVDRLICHALPNALLMALVADGRLVELQIVRRDRPSLVDGVFLGRLERVMPELDAAVSGLAQLVEPVPAVMNEANAYYDRKDYLDDDFKAGRAYHAQLVKTVPPLLAARDVVMQQIAVLGEQLDAKEIDMIEAINGRKYLWHSRRVLAMAGKLTPFFDWKPEKARSEELILSSCSFVRLVDDSSVVIFRLS